jgi:hypothetical protein
MWPQGERHRLKPQPLPIAAITATTLALFSATSIPVLGTNDDLRNLTIGTAIVCWIAHIAHTATNQIHRHLAEARADVDQIRRLQKIEGLLQEAGAGSELTLPTPHGDIHPIPADIDGETILVGVDESTHLADVINLRHAMAGSEDRAAK